MKKLADLSILVAVASVIVGIIAKLMMKVTIMGVFPKGYLQFAGVCLLLAIALYLRKE